MALRDNFPPAGIDYLGGESDGWEYRTVFAGSTLQATYNMVVQFLREEGYGDVPLPKDAEELKLFRWPTRNKQVLLFMDNGYVHNPVKILFPIDGRKRATLILAIYNEAEPHHLLKFHGLYEKYLEESGQHALRQELKEARKKKEAEQTPPPIILPLEATPEKSEPDVLPHPAEPQPELKSQKNRKRKKVEKEED